MQDQIIDGHRYQWDGTDWVRAEARSKPAGRRRAPIVIAALAGVAILGGGASLTTAAVSEPGAPKVTGIPSTTGTTSEAELFVDTMTSEQLARELQADAIDQAGDPVEIRDAECRETGETTASGTGWYVCSWRTPGDPRQIVYTVEVESDASWSYTWAQGVAGPVANLSEAQVERILVDPSSVAFDQINGAR